MASWHGHASVVQVLVAADADKDHRDEEGKTALDWTVERGHEEAQQALREGR